MVEKRETVHQMLRRCFNWDYKRPGSYIVTLTLADIDALAKAAALID